MKIFDDCSTSGETTPALALDDLKKIIDQIEEIKFPRFWLSRFCPQDRIYHGAMIDKVLGLRSREQGFMLHPRWEPFLRLHFETNPWPLHGFDDFIVKPRLPIKVWEGKIT